MKFTKEIGRGGEGVVYETDRRDGQVCKVLHQSRRSKSTIEKLKLMIELQVEHPAICWPIELVEGGGETIGYLMPRASGKELQRTIFIRPLFETAVAAQTTIDVLRTTIPWTDADAVREALATACIAEMNKRAGALGSHVRDLAATQPSLRSTKSNFLPETSVMGSWWQRSRAVLV